MLVKCPGCFTTYRVSDRLVTSNKPAFRCSRCKLIFALELKRKGDLAGEEKPSSESIQRSTDSEPDLPFAASQGEAPELKTEDPNHFTQSPNPPETEVQESSIPTSLERIRREPTDSSLTEFTGASLTGSTEPTPTEQPEQQFFPGAETTTEETPAMAEEEPPAEAQIPAEPPPQPWDLEDKRETALAKQRKLAQEILGVQEAKTEAEAEAATDDFSSREERREREVGVHSFQGGGPVSVIPYISLFGLLLLGFSLLTLMHQFQPERLEAYLKPIPWFGPTVLENKHLREGVVVGSLRTSFQRVLGNREVFVITGKIYNRNPVSVGEIRVEGQIHAGEGKEIARQAISVGNPISQKIIRDMTVREIAILQRLRPQKRFEVAPEGSAAFTIVFLKPTKEIKTFSCQVLSAKGIS